MSGKPIAQPLPLRSVLDLVTVARLQITTENAALGPITDRITDLLNKEFGPGAVVSVHINTARFRRIRLRGE